MPGRDGTGPWGKGPMTGRGAGFCGTGVARGNRRFAGGPAAGNGMGPGPGRGCGGGRGWRNMYYATGEPGWSRVRQETAPDQDDATGQTTLQDRVEELQREVELLRKRLGDRETPAE